MQASVGGSKIKKSKTPKDYVMTPLVNPMVKPVTHPSISKLKNTNSVKPNSGLQAFQKAQKPSKPIVKSTIVSPVKKSVVSVTTKKPVVTTTTSNKSMISSKQPKNTTKQTVTTTNKQQIPTTVKPVGSTTATTATKPVTTPTAQQLKPADKDMSWFNYYTNAIKNGTANTANIDIYNNMGKKYGLQTGTIDNKVLQDLSVKALSGDVNAQNYLKAMHYSALTGQNLWKGIDPSTLKYQSGAYNQYEKDNPFTDFTKADDMKHYDMYNDMIKNKKPMTPAQVQRYQDIISKWNLDDQSNPLYQQAQQAQTDETNYLDNLAKTNQTTLDNLAQGKQSSLDAQDVYLNNTMSQLDANNFQQFQQLQQDMSNRGMGDSGIAADAYMRATMGANQNYQDALAQSAQNKANINNDYIKNINQTNTDYTDKVGQVKSNYTDSIGAIHNAIQQQKNDKIAADKKAKEDAAIKAEQAKKDEATAAIKAKQEASAAQEKRDEFLTTQTGVVYQNGKPVLDSKGKPITTISWQKMTETQRHNIATENNTATKNTNDYNLGQTKIKVDLQKSIAKNKLDSAKIDLGYAKLESQNKYNQDKIKSIADKESDTKTKMQLTALGKQSDTVAKQIMALQKKKTLSKSEKSTLKKLVGKYNNVNDSISKLIGGSSFNDEVKGVDYSKYNGYSTFKKNFAKSGVDHKWLPVMSEIVKRESSFNPNAQNPTSSAHGYGQFLKSTRRTYEKKLGLDYDNPIDQITMMAEYIKDRYGTPEKALSFWNKHHWY